jgi:sRNA-binding protein
MNPKVKASPDVGVKMMRALCESFPAAFNVSRPKPLKLHIDKDLLASGGLSQDVIGQGLACYTGRSRYLDSLTVGATRIDLEGKPAGTVSERHAGDAKHRLAALQKRRTRAGAAVNAPKKQTITIAPAKQKPSSPIVVIRKKRPVKRSGKP